MKNTNTPLRGWASASYNKETGRAASAFGSTSAEGESTVGNSQIEAAHGKPGRGSPTCRENDRERSNQGGK